MSEKKREPIKLRISCYEIASIGCCGSCHTEWDYEFGDPFEHDLTPRTTLFSCCGHGDLVNLPRQQKAKLLREVHAYRLKERVRFKVIRNL